MALSTLNFSAYGDTTEDVLKGLFNELDWTREQINDFQNLGRDGYLTSFCAAGDVSCTYA